MYSIVMLTAMSAGADVTPPPAPAPHAVAPAAVVAGCTGCTGYYASCYGSCYGSGYSSCSGSCYGCSGGHFAGKHKGGFLGGRHSCHGSGSSCSGYTCFGSCYGSGYGNNYGCGGCFGLCYGSCYGSVYGCTGSWHTTSYGIYGGAPIGYQYGPSMPGGYSCAGTCHGGALVIYGSSWGPPIGMPPYSLHGYNTGAPIWGAGPPVVHGYLTDSQSYYPNLPPEVTVPPMPEPKPKSGGSDSKPMGANLKFKVPADTKLYVDGTLAPGTGPERVFYTPKLEPGKQFFYDVKAEVVVNGKTVTEEKRVIVEAGADVTEDFAKLAAAVARPDTVAGK